MDYEIKMEPGDPSTNSLTATLVTKLTEAEEAKWKGMLADAWDEGYAQKESEFLGLRLTRRNPYRQ